MGFWKIFTSVKTVPRSLQYNKITIRTCSAEKPKCLDKPTSENDGKPSDGIKKGVVLGVYQGEKELTLSTTAEEVNQQSNGKFCKHLNELGRYLKLGKTCIVTDLIPDTTVAISLLGAKDAGYNKLEELDEARENIRLGVGAGVMRLRDEGCISIQVDTAGAPDAAAEAALLAAWRFQEFKSPGARLPAVTVSAYGVTGGGVAASGVAGSVAADGSWEQGAVLGCCQNWARFLADMPANAMAPVDLAQAALDVLCPLGVKVEARDYDWIKTNNMQAFMAVARGSCEAPVFLECEYRGSGTSPPLLLAAKGVTFDSGGLCLKKPESMAENRGSMAGAAAALAALRAAALFKLPINIACVIPICENMVSGQCMKVGDVVRALNGLSIQIEHTDLEGRLMLADALVYGQHKFSPSLIIDIATFTHGILLATGGGAFGCFSNSAGLWQRLQAAGAHTGDRPWRFPLWNYYHRQITNEAAVDLRNKGSGRATPCLGAAFLSNFICGPWLHLDITGVGKLGWERAPAYLSPRRMTGRPARTLAHFLRLQALQDCPGDKQQ